MRVSSSPSLASPHRHCIVITSSPRRGACCHHLLRRCTLHRHRQIVTAATSVVAPPPLPFSKLIVAFPLPLLCRRHRHLCSHRCRSLFPFVVVVASSSPHLSHYMPTDFLLRPILQDPIPRSAHLSIRARSTSHCIFASTFHLP